MIQKIVSATALAIMLTVSPLSMPEARAFGANGIYAQSAIMSAGKDAAIISQLRHVPRVGVVRLDLMYMSRFHLGDDFDLSDFKISAQKNAQGVAKLRAALMNNPVTRRAIAGIPINKIVGVKIGSDGALRLYRV